MLKVNEIQGAIEALPEQDYVQLRQWFSEQDWGKWDKQIEANSEAGKLAHGSSGHSYQSALILWQVWGVV